MVYVSLMAAIILLTLATLMQMAPFRGQRYHLGGFTTQNLARSAEEYFNLCHARARNIIERAFGRLKGRWTILRSASYFPMKTQCRIITACALLHNLILQKMSQDPFACDEQLMEASLEQLEGEISEPEFITAISTSNEWTGFRNNLAQEMMNQAMSTSSGSTHGRGKDVELIKALYDLSLDPKRKSEGNFKNGYLSVLESVLAQKQPSSNLTAMPHIESRVRHFRTKYGAIENHPNAKGLYGIAFPHFVTLAAIYGKDIATGEGAEGLVDAVTNMEKEITLEANDVQEVEVERDSMSRETPPWWASDRNSVDSTSSSSKRRKRTKGNEVSKSSDPFLDMASDIRGDLKIASASFGKMAEAMERQAKVEEEATHEDPMQALQNKSIDELTRLRFSGSELLKTAVVFVKVPNQMTMLFALLESLMREFILQMIKRSVGVFVSAFGWYSPQFSMRSQKTPVTAVPN
ncbi:LOW QUALITY PROTEIN: hypothetical protein U9M48_029066 [Paspalum notatum var. saurae]|uniref:DDE Tnp4 domain-containing protein n=1 Tax=Paspalum notatum var. saurae TaxID=547442 RepID=A0AAQ3U2H8_PASNO